MIRQLGLLLCGMFLLAGAAGAEGLRVGVWTAYGLVSMSEVNQFIVDSFGNLASSDAVKGSSLDKIQSCSVLGFDAGYQFFPNIALGVRYATITSAQGIVGGTYLSPLPGAPAGNFRMTIDSRAIPFMVGGEFRQKMNDRWNIAASLYVGYALANATFRFQNLDPRVFNDIFPGRGPDGEVSFDGSGIADDVAGEIQYMLSNNIVLGLNLHLMTVRVSQLTSNQLSGGGTLQDWAGRVLAFDYSNIAVGASLNVFF